MSDEVIKHPGGRPPGSAALRQKTERKVHRWLAARLKRDFPHLRDPRYMTELAVYCSTYILHQRAAKRILQNGGDDPLVILKQANCAVRSIRFADWRSRFPCSEKILG
jgi:hypothetical protein